MKRSLMYTHIKQVWLIEWRVILQLAKWEKQSSNHRWQFLTTTHKTRTLNKMNGTNKNEVIMWELWKDPPPAQSKGH